MTTFPPASASAVFLTHNRKCIAAPAALVWQILVTPSTWPDWNAVIPSCTGASGADGRLRKGDKLRFTMSFPPPAGKTKGTARTVSSLDALVETLEEPEQVGNRPDTPYHASWSRRGTWSMPLFALTNLRVLEVVPLDESTCEYRSYEAMNGPLAWVLKWLMASRLEEAFEEWAEGLKEEAEKQVETECTAR